MLAIDSTEAPAQPGEGVFFEGKPVGSITSAAWGYRIGKNLAMAYVDPAHGHEGTMLDVLLIGKSTRAIVMATCPFDPGNTIPKGARTGL